MKRHISDTCMNLNLSNNTMQRCIFTIQACGRLLACEGGVVFLQFIYAGFLLYSADRLEHSSRELNSQFSRKQAANALELIQNRPPRTSGKPTWLIFRTTFIRTTGRKDTHVFMDVSQAGYLFLTAIDAGELFANTISYPPFGRHTIRVNRFWSSQIFPSP